MKSPLFRTLISGVIIMSLFNCNAADNATTVRRPAVADRFYTGNPSKLRKEIEGYLAAGKELKEHPQIIISPHAGYVFSGPVAGIGFATIDKSAKKVILIGPSHTKFFNDVSIPEVDAYETPLGTVPLDKKGIKKLRASALVHAYADAHSQEHCLEVQLPFLQVLLTDFTIIPIIVGNLNSPADFAELIYPLIDGKTLVVISSDFSHYHSHKDAKNIDKRSIETILSGNPAGFFDACGETPIRIAMQLALKMNMKPHLLDARNSYETAPQYGSGDRVVGYASIVYLKNTGSESREENRTGSAAKPKQELTESDKVFMLKLARDALDRAVKGEKPPEPENVPPVTQESSGCFVTLTKHGDLRGCIGYIEGIKPLYEAIIDNAKNAALGDPRFPNVTPDELKDLRVEVSVLTPPEPIEYTDPDDLLSKITPGVDGIILRKGMHQSTYLPQVWDQLPDKVGFLQHLAMKAGMDRDDWKDAQYKKYQAIHFEEE
jgi:AmmeMemoRadiSam system protein B/AmmeMemoRadiSam system protein A